MGRRGRGIPEDSPIVRPAWAAIGVVLACVLLKAFLAHSRVPFWDADPTVEAATETTLTPFLAFVVDAVIVAGSARIVLSRRRSEDQFPWLSGVMVVLGCAGVLLHGAVLTPRIAAGGTTALWGDPASLLLGCAWLSAMVGAWTVALAARDAAVRRAVLAILMSAALVLVARGGYQVFVEHPRLVADFRQHREEILWARGWEPDSATARLFERRLMQAEATGWFGLANAYGSILAMATVSLTAMAAGAWGRWRRKQTASGDAGALSLAALIAAIGLCLSGSKGAIGAALAGGLGAVLFARPGASRTRRWIGPVICAAVGLGVVARGLLGERLGELSLLFRWHYAVGAARTITEHPLLGVGPAGFKDAYLLNKPPVNPEEVESAHSLPLDWLATLGVFGVAWLGVWCSWLARLGHRPSEDPVADRSPAPSWLWPVALGLPVGLSAAREWPALMPDLGLLVGVAAIGAWIIARLAANPGVVGERALAAAAGGAAVGLSAHLMIEVTGTLPGSAAWALVFIAVASTKPATPEDVPLFEDQARRGNGRAAWAGVLACVAGAILWLGAAPARLWGAALQRAVAHLEPVREARRSPLKSSTPAALVAQAERSAVPRALAELEAADTVWPGRPEALDAASRLNMRQAVDCAAAVGTGGEECDEAARRSVGIAEELAERFPQSSGAWARLGRTLRALGQLTGDQSAQDDARKAWERAALLDPFSLTPAVELCDLSIALKDARSAAEWAGRVLATDLDLRLDPIKRLTNSERMRIQSILDGGDRGTTGPAGSERPPP